MFFWLKAITFIAARRERSRFSLIAFVLSDAAASGRKHRHALCKEGGDALFDIRSGKNPMAVAQRARDRLLRCLVKRIAHAGADEAQRQSGADRSEERRVGK